MRAPSENIEQLLKDRPDQRGNLLAWKGSAAMHRAVLAHEAGNNGEFLKHLQAARAAFAEAAKQTSGNEGAAAITGGTYAVFADRLPEPHRATAWADAYSNYSLLWKQQGSAIDKLPVHHRGEVLGGLVQSAQRTGRTEEMAQHLDRMLTLMQGTPYEKRWILTRSRSEMRPAQSRLQVEVERGRSLSCPLSCRANIIGSSSLPQ